MTPFLGRRVFQPKALALKGREMLKDAVNYGAKLLVFELQKPTSTQITVVFFWIELLRKHAGRLGHKQVGEARKSAASVAPVRARKHRWNCMTGKYKTATHRTNFARSVFICRTVQRARYGARAQTAPHRIYRLTGGSRLEKGLHSRGNQPRLPRHYLTEELVASQCK